MAWQLHTYESADALAVGLVNALAAATDAALDARGHAWLALAGGRTPFPAYRLFAARPLRWRDVFLLPTDERCVPHDHAACNLRGMIDAFADADGANIESLTTADGDGDRSEAHAQDLLARRAGAFDAVVLGMGNDAHTASLFPGAPQLAAALDPHNRAGACRVDPDPLPPEAPFPRISLTAARLLHARTLHLLLTGADKRAVLERAIADPDPLRHPIAALLQSPAAHVQVHWCA